MQDGRSNKNSARDSLIDLIKEIPKAETHVHFLGTVRDEKNDIIIPDAAPDMPLDVFIRSFLCRRKFIKTPYDIYHHAALYLCSAFEQNVRHVEFTFALPFFLDFPMEDVFRSFKKAFDEAFTIYGMTGGIVVDMIRDAGPVFAARMLDGIIKKDNGIVSGMGLCGSETSAPPEAFSTIFEKARAYGYKTSVHIGEQTSGKILDTFSALKPDRIDHATMIFKEPAAVNLFAENRIPITVCLTSNERLGIVGRSEHPLRKMISAGLNISLHTDDPAIFGCDLVGEYMKAFSEYGLSLREIRKLARQSFVSGFLSEKRNGKTCGHGGGS